MNHHPDIPVEIVSLIVNQLSPKDYYQCAFINRPFYAVVNPRLWRNITIHNQFIAVKFLISLVKAPKCVRKHIQHLYLNCRRWNNFMFFLLIKHLSDSELQDLTIHNGYDMTDTSLQLLPRHCPHLKSLYLEQYHLTQRSMAILLQQCRHLCTLRLDHCFSWSLTSVSGLVPCPLEKLTIMTENPLRSKKRGEETHVIDLSCFPQLTHLNLSGDRHHSIRLSLFIPPAPTHAARDAHCPHLVSLSLADCVLLGPNDLTGFIKSHPDLQSLSLYIEDSPCTDTDLNAICTYCPGFSELSIPGNSHISRRGLCHLVRNCPDLCFVNLNGCEISGYRFPELDDEYQDEDGNLENLDAWAIRQIRLYHDDDDEDDDDDDDNGWEDNQRWDDDDDDNERWGDDDDDDDEERDGDDDDEEGDDYEQGDDDN